MPASVFPVDEWRQGKSTLPLGKVVDMTCYFYDSCSEDDYKHLFEGDLRYYW